MRNSLFLALIIINTLLSIVKHFDDNSYVLQYGLLLCHCFFFLLSVSSELLFILFCAVFKPYRNTLFFPQSTFHWDEVGTKPLSLAPLFMTSSKKITYFY